MVANTNASVAVQQAFAPGQHIFSSSQWAHLAQLLANQDIVLLPSGTGLGQAADVDETAEKNYRKASALALASHWASMGFNLSKSDTLSLCEQDATAHAWLHKNVTPALKQRLGGHVRMQPMYPNFPKQVMEMDDAVLWFNALLHYTGDLFNLRILPEYEKKERKPLRKSEGQERALQVVDIKGLKQFLSNLTQMNTVWTPAQTELAKAALPLLVHWDIVSEKTALPQRENQAHIVGHWLTLVGKKEIQGDVWPANRISTTDILRAAVAYSNGDPSLASSSEKVRFARMSRAQRRILMNALEKAVVETNSPLEDLFNERQGWLRLAEKLHVGEWHKQVKAREAIDVLRNHDAPPTWNSQLNAVLEQPASDESVQKAVSLFAKNPGYAARALRRVVLWAQDRSEVITKAFAEVADRVDTPVLLSVEATFKAEKAQRQRVMLPKGDAAWRYRVDGKSATLDREIKEEVIRICQDKLVERFSALEPLGKVYVEKGLDDVIVPKGLRSASDSVGVVTRGSWLPVDDDAKVIRLFLWWKDTDQGRVDVDLSAVGVTKNFRSSETCNYQALKGSGLVHSGDITSAPEGAAEFIDIYLDETRKETRYVVLTANVFTGPTFKKLPECFVGWQERQSKQRGEIMELSTVVDKFQVTANAKGFLGVVFDVKERKIMWLDLPSTTRSGLSIHGDMKNICAAVEDFQLYAESQPKIGHLVALHVLARGGEIVENPKDADIVFSVNTRVAKKDQVVVAATQPQTVAAALLQGPVKNQAKNVANSSIEKQENELNELNKVKKKRARKPS